MATHLRTDSSELPPFFPLISSNTLLSHCHCCHLWLMHSHVAMVPCTRRSQRKRPVIIVQVPAEDSQVPLQTAAHADIPIQNNPDIVNTTLANASPSGIS